MGYINATELNPNLPAKLDISASSTPDLISAQTFITGISAELDSAAAHAGYQTPISSTASYAYDLMRNYTIYGAGWRVLSVMMPNQGGPKDKVALSEQYHDAYDKAIQGIRDGTISLIGAPETGGGTNAGRILPRSYLTTHRDATACPQVRMSQVW